MKIKTQKTNNRRRAFFITFTLIILILLIGTIFFFINRTIDNSGVKSANPVNLEPPTEEQLSEGERIKEESLGNGSPVPPTTDIGMYVTASSISGETYRLRVLINKLSSDGTCVLSLTSPGNNPVTLSPVGIQPLPNGSTCQGFDIPLSDLSASKTWTANIDFIGPDSYGKVSEEISL